MEKQSKVAAILMVAVLMLLVINNLRLNSRMRNLEELLQDTNIQLSHSANNIRSSISILRDTLSEQIIQSTRITFNEHVNISAYNAATTMVDMQLSFYLREYTPGSIVTITARGQDGQVYTGNATRLDGRFVSDMSLPMHDSYTLTFTAVGDTIVTGEIMQFSPTVWLTDRFILWIGQELYAFRYTGGAASITITPRFRNNTHGNPMLNINSMVMQIEVDGIVVKTRCLTNYLFDTGYYQVLDLMGRRSRSDVKAMTMPIPIETVNKGTITLNFGDGYGQIPSGTTVYRLVIYDNLGIRYEETSMLYRGSLPLHELRASDWAWGWGQIRIVE